MQESYERPAYCKGICSTDIRGNHKAIFPCIAHSTVLCTGAVEISWQAKQSVAEAVSGVKKKVYSKRYEFMIPLTFE
jgi:hypothetical protein